MGKLFGMPKHQRKCSIINGSTNLQFDLTKAFHCNNPIILKLVKLQRKLGLAIPLNTFCSHDKLSQQLWNLLSLGIRMKKITKWIIDLVILGVPQACHLNLFSPLVFTQSLVNLDRICINIQLVIKDFSQVTVNKTTILIPIRRIC